MGSEVLVRGRVLREERREKMESESCIVKVNAEE